MIGIVSMERITYADPPHRFEAGTPPILDAIGFGAAVQWLETVDRAAAAEPVAAAGLERIVSAHG